MGLKEKFVLDYLTDIDPHIDILNKPFVDIYITKFKPRHKRVNWGADKVPELGRLLSSMYRKGLLKRSCAGINDAVMYGFPRWVYIYYIAK